MSGVVGDVLWKPGIADLVEGIDQGVLAVRLERNVKVDRGVGGGKTQGLPVRGDGLPCVLSTHVVPMW